MFTFDSAHITPRILNSQHNSCFSWHFSILLHFFLHLEFITITISPYDAIGIQVWSLRYKCGFI